MSIQFVLLPLFVQVALTFALLFWMARSRIRALNSEQVKMADVALRAAELAARTCSRSRTAINSQFQLAGAVLRADDPGDRHCITPTSYSSCWLGCSCSSRLLHAYIHTGTNYVRHRFNAFAAGVFILMAMWAIFAVRILLALP